MDASELNLGTGFWGAPRYAPRNKDVARDLEAIRTLTKNASPARKLKVATSALHAITSFVTVECGPRETLALLDKLRAELLERVGE